MIRIPDTTNVSSYTPVNNENLQGQYGHIKSNEGTSLSNSTYKDTVTNDQELDKLMDDYLDTQDKAKKVNMGFWEKFRDTVMPDPNEPQNNNPPKEYPPEKEPPK